MYSRQWSRWRASVVQVRRTAAAIAAARLGVAVMVVDRLITGGYMTAVGGAGLDGFVDLRTGLPVGWCLSF